MSRIAYATVDGEFDGGVSMDTRDESMAYLISYWDPFQWLAGAVCVDQT